MASIPASDHVTATLEFVDAYGNVVDAGLPAAPSWVSSAAELVVTVADGGLSADVSPTGVVVTGASVSATFDLGAGPVTVTSELIDVVAGAAVSGTIVLGAPVAK